MDLTDPEDRLRWELYSDHKKQAWADIQSSTDSYDQSLLTLSTGALALSIAFIKDIVGLQNAIWLVLLYFSWIAFGLCILITVLSFQVAKAAQNEHLGFCWNYYVLKDDSFRNVQGKWSKRLNRCTIGAGTLFVVALACTIGFGIVNVERRPQMSDKDSSRRLQEGRASVAMTPVPPLPVPKPAAPPPASSPTPKKD